MQLVYRSNESFQRRTGHNSQGSGNDGTAAGDPLQCTTGALEWRLTTEEQRHIVIEECNQSYDLVTRHTLGNICSANT